MIDVTKEHIKQSKAQLKVILQFLRRSAKKSDELRDALNQAGKTEEAMMKSITDKAYSIAKEAKGEFAVISDKEVFQWALNYVFEGYVACEATMEEMLEEFYSGWGVCTVQTTETS